MPLIPIEDYARSRNQVLEELQAEQEWRGASSEAIKEKTVDEYGRQIQEGKQIVIDYIQKERPDFAKRINALVWVKSMRDRGPGFHRLVIQIGKERHSIKFFQTELEDSTGTPGGDRRLKRRIDTFFKML